LIWKENNGRAATYKAFPTGNRFNIKPAKPTTNRAILGKQVQVTATNHTPRFIHRIYGRKSQNQ
jgi:hypothetical protein